MERERGAAGLPMARLVDKLHADARLANVAYLALLKHAEFNEEDEDQDTAAIISQLRKLTTRLEKRHRQAERLIEAKTRRVA
jgi:hypothetical protein